MRRIDALVAEHGAVPRAQMKSFRRHMPALEALLRQRGLEIGSTIRRPLEGQLLAAVEGGFVPAKGLERRLAGATATEVKKAVVSLRAQRALLEVVRHQGAGYTLPSADVVDPAELSALLDAVVKAQKLLKRAKAASKGQIAVTVLRADLEDVFAKGKSTTGDALTLEIERRVREAAAPLRVPELLRSLSASIEEGHRALMEGVERGLFQLEPESGMGRLSPEDARICPVGPMGTRLSWVRPVLPRKEFMHDAS